MEDLSARQNSNSGYKEPLYMRPVFESPGESFAKPKAKLKSPSWENESPNFHQNLDGIAKFEDQTHEYQVKYDIYGKVIMEHLNSPFTHTSGSTKEDSSRNNSHNKSSGKDSSGKDSKNSPTNEDIDEEEEEWTVDKENFDPVSSVLTPLKPKTKP